MNIFEEVRSRVTIQQAVEYLRLELTKIEHGKDGEQYRYPCPACKGTDKRSISVNMQKGFRCFAGDKKGDDATALVAHVKGIRNGEAAQLLKEHFISAARASSSTKPEAKAEGKGRSDARQGVRPLELDHPVIEMLGINPDVLEAIGGGYDGERIQIPLRTEAGELRGTLGIATTADQAPLLLFSESIESVAKPQPDELRKLFRVV